jgi:uncharacterized protein (DUF433 family)
MDLNTFDRIVSSPDILGGKPCIKGTRISVEFILELLASGGDRASIMRSYPHLSAQDIDQAIRFAARILKNDVIVNAEIRP